MHISYRLLALAIEVSGGWSPSFAPARCCFCGLINTCEAVSPQSGAGKSIRKGGRVHQKRRAGFYSARLGTRKIAVHAVHTAFAARQAEATPRDKLLQR